MFDQSKADRICDRIARGASLRASASAEGVDPSTVLRWTKASPEFAQQYAHARETGYQLLADEIIDISDERDVRVTQDGEEVRLTLDSAAVARNRLRVDTRKWMLAKMLPKVYGENSTTTHEVGETVTAIVRQIVKA